MYKILGAMSEDLYIETSAHFGIESVENLVANRRNRFINRYGETDNIYVKCCADCTGGFTGGQGGHPQDARGDI